MPAEFIQHRSPQTNKAKAPYNFVPLPEKVLEAEAFSAHDKYDSERHTGYIELEIKTETPLYTRCAFPTSVYQNPNNFDDKGKLKVTADINCQQFFHRGDARIPVIPGSTLRGMTRSLVEILSYSKIFAVTKKEFLYRAVGDTTSLGMKYKETMFGSNNPINYPSKKVKGGYIEKSGNSYYIRPALEPDGKGESFIHIDYSSVNNLIGLTSGKGRHLVHNIFVKPIGRTNKRVVRQTRNGEFVFNLNLAISNQVSDTQQNGLYPAKLIESGHMGKPIEELANPHDKHMHCAIFEPNTDAALILINDEMWQTYENDYQKVLDRSNPQRRLENGQPVFYVIDKQNNLLFFGPTMLFRLPYKTSTHDFVPADRMNDEVIDFAESIFGVVNSKIILSGRLFFTDAICQTESPFLGDENDDGRRVPKTLSSPKPTAFQMYLNQPSSDDRREFKTYLPEDEKQTQIRGFKRYWHKNGVGRDDVFDEVQERNIDNVSSQHTIIRPVLPNVMFKSQVYFENLSNIELGALLTALELSRTKRHQIGMAKSYGLGSVRIEAKLNLQSPKIRYESLFGNDNTWSTGNENKGINSRNTFKKHFSDEIIEHYKDKIRQDSNVTLLEEIPRLKQLYTMLEWEHQINLDEISYVGIPHNQWSKRHVLPFPQHVENNNSGEIEFHIDNTSENVSPLNQNVVQSQPQRNEEELQQASGNRDNHYLNEIRKFTTFNKNELSEIGKKIIKKKMSKEVAEAFWDKIIEFEAVDQFSGEWFSKLEELADK